MPYNSKGEWVDEDQNVSSRLPGLLSSSSPLMKAAAKQGERYANRRGLQNSSIGAQAAQREVLNVALPIASQEASQTFQRNLSGQTYRQEGFLQGSRIQSQEKIAGMDIASREKVAGMEIKSRESVASQERRAAMDRQLAADAAAKDRLGIQLTSEEQRAKDAVEAEDRRRATELESRENIAEQDRGANVQANVTTATNNTRSNYNSRVNAINSNPEIPASERAKMIQDAGVRFDADMMLIEQIYQVDLDWPLTPETAPNTNPTADEDAAQRRER